MEKNKKNDRIFTFKDSMKLFETEKELIESIQSSIKNQKIILETQNIMISSQDYNRFEKPFELEISNKRSLEAAKLYCQKGKRVCVLNFASHKNPGGGVAKGANGQEECICRISTLFPCLKDEFLNDNFYSKHKDLYDLNYNDDLIYTPNITIFKIDDDNEKMLDKNEWYNVDIISCAAPNLKHVKKFNKKDEDIMNLHLKRGKKILDCAVKEKCDVIILGAFGCGCFGNPPNLVAKAYKKLLKDYQLSFEIVEFAIYSPNDNKNLLAFQEVFDYK